MTVIIQISIGWLHEVGLLFRRSQCLVKSRNQYPHPSVYQAHAVRRLTMINTIM